MDTCSAARGAGEFFHGVAGNFSAIHARVTSRSVRDPHRRYRLGAPAYWSLRPSPSSQSHSRHHSTAKTATRGDTQFRAGAGGVQHPKAVKP
eukprot:5218653-Prymnesium_polylepis.1